MTLKIMQIWTKIQQILEDQKDFLQICIFNYQK
jgi:hypothetical protein